MTYKPMVLGRNIRMLSFMCEKCGDPFAVVGARPMRKGRDDPKFLTHCQRCHPT